ncbi:nuclear transport factor 2 family protein [Nocardia tengchongensis]|uniref:nuclear transport factor 2 family protein n=1 Tax=Nocardia tengchongensis TaxID=2055889 RepID=UPI0036B1371B
MPATARYWSSTAATTWPSTTTRTQRGRSRIRITGHAVATGAEYANRYISVLTIADREITPWRDYLDPLAVFDAIGWPDNTGADE